MAAAIDKFVISVAMLFAASLTCTVHEKLPDIVGVPEIIPIDVKLNPDGSVPDTTLQLYGLTPPVACKSAEYEAPACPAGSEVVVIVKVGGLITIEKLA